MTVRQKNSTEEDHTHTQDEGKMADAVSEDIEAALNKIVKTTDQSGNLRKDLKKTIFETVSNLRNYLLN